MNRHYCKQVLGYNLYLGRLQLHLYPWPIAVLLQVVISY